MKFLNYLSSQNKIRFLSECFYTVTFALFLLYRSLKNTTFDTSYLSNMNRVFMALFCVAVAMQIMTHIENKKSVAIAIVVLAMSISAYQHNQYIDVLMAGFLIAGCIDVNADRILKIWTIVISAAIIAAAFAAFTGIIENYVYVAYRSYGYRVRSALGTVYPTDSATWILFGLAFIWAAWKQITDEAMLVVTAAAVALFYYYQGSKTAVLCGILLMLFIFFDRICKKNINKILGFTISITTPLCAVMMLGFSYLYGRGNILAAKLDKLIDNRFSQSYKGIASYGIKLLGTNFKMYGAGSGSTDSSYKYFYLDSSYTNILIRFGIIIFLLYICLWIFTANKLTGTGNRRLLLVALLITIQSIEEHHFAGIVYNPLLFMALSNFTPENCIVNENSISNYKNDKKRIAVQIGLVIFGGIVIIAFLPKILAAGRTLYQSNSIDVQTVLDADRNAVEIILDSATSPVYTDVLPLDYCKEFDGLKSGLYFEGDHSRTEKCTILVNGEYESIPLLTRGFLFSQISENTSVYTNDKCVSDALMNAGYHVTGFYSKKKDAIVKDGKKVEKLTLQNKKYATTWCLNITKEPKEIADINEVVCTVKASSDIVYSPEVIAGQIDNGEDSDISTPAELCSKQVLRSDFDENGKAIIELGFTPGIEPGVKLSLKNEKGFKVTIEACEYYQAPDYDIHNVLDCYGRTERSEYYDLDGNRILTNQGYFAVEYQYNGSGLISKADYFDIYGNRVIISNGYSAIKYDYNEAGQVISEKYYDENDNPMTLATGQASDTRVLDDRGNILEICFFDIEGNPVVLTTGSAEIHRAYDEQNRIIKESYYGIDSEPIMIQDGYHEIHKVYDELSRVTDESYYGISGEPILNVLGVSKIHREYDDHNRVTRAEFFDTEGNRAENPLGASAEEYEYDGKNRISYWKYYDSFDNRVRIKNGFAGLRRIYDDYGRIIGESYYDEEDQPLALETGQASDTRVVDSNGNIIVLKYYGVDGQPTTITYGFAEIHREYDTSNRIIREEFYDINGMLVNNFAKYAVKETKYDENGQVSEELLYDLNGNLVIK